MPHVNWSSRVSPNADETDLLSMTIENCLFQLVKPSTHKHVNILNICFVTNDYFYSVEVDYTALMSTHFPVHTTLDVSMVYNDEDYVAQTNISIASTPIH